MHRSLRGAPPSRWVSQALGPAQKLAKFCSIPYSRPSAPGRKDRNPTVLQAAGIGRKRRSRSEGGASARRLGTKRRAGGPRALGPKRAKEPRAWRRKLHPSHEPAPRKRRARPSRSPRDPGPSEKLAGGGVVHPSPRTAARTDLPTLPAPQTSGPAAETPAAAPPRAPRWAQLIGCCAPARVRLVQSAPRSAFWKLFPPKSGCGPATRRPWAGEAGVERRSVESHWD